MPNKDDYALLLNNQWQTFAVPVLTVGAHGDAVPTTMTFKGLLSSFQWPVFLENYWSSLDSEIHLHLHVPKIIFISLPYR